MPVLNLCTNVLLLLWQGLKNSCEFVKWVQALVVQGRMLINQITPLSRGVIVPLNGKNVFCPCVIPLVIRYHNVFYKASLL